MKDKRIIWECRKRVWGGGRICRRIVQVFGMHKVVKIDRESDHNSIIRCPKTLIDSNHLVSLFLENKEKKKKIFYRTTECMSYEFTFSGLIVFNSSYLIQYFS